ncbi:hypothetical protein P3W45_000488 [Vairimorpha bombi]|jgi:RNA recognition motif-containing protein
MKIFIGKIPADLDPDSIYNHFKAFGEVSNYNFKGQFAFIDYVNEDDGYKVLEKREQEINGQCVIVEMSNSKPKSRSDYNDRPPRSDFDEGRRDPYYYQGPPRYEDKPYSTAPRYEDKPYSAAPRYEDKPYSAAPRYEDKPYSAAPRYDEGYSRSRYEDYPHKPRYEAYTPRHSDRRYDNYPPPAYKDESRRVGDYRAPTGRDDCPHCSRCEFHGIDKSRQDPYERKRPKREHPNDVNKIVIQDIPQNISIGEIDDFVKSNGFEIVFSRLTLKGDSAIVELKSTTFRDEAIEKLNGLELNGARLLVREFRVSGNLSVSNTNQYSEKSNNDNNNYDWNTNQDNKDNNSDWSTNQDNKDNQGVDIYSGIENGWGTEK